MYFRAKTGGGVFLYPQQPSNPITLQEKADRDPLLPGLHLKAIEEDETKSWFKVEAHFAGGDRQGWFGQSKWNR